MYFRKRLTIQDALNHPWIKVCYQLEIVYLKDIQGPFTPTTITIKITIKKFEM